MGATEMMKRSELKKIIREILADISDTDISDTDNSDTDFSLEEKEYIPVKRSDDGRRSKKARVRRKDEPFGEDPLGRREYEKSQKLDTAVGYDANKKKYLQRRKRR
jgi:hypothetical protein